MNISFDKSGGASGSKPVPVIDIKTEQVPTPVAGVTVECHTGGPVTDVKVEGGVSPVGVPAVQSRNAGFISGDDLPAFKDVMLPRLNIVHDIGGLKDTFSPGELVWGQQTVLFTPPVINKQTGNVDRQGTAPVILTVLGEVQKRFHEIVEGGMGGMIVNTEAEVRTSGGTLDYSEWKMKKQAGMKRFGPLLDLLVVIQRPATVKDDDAVFGFEVEGHKYALGLWSLSKTSYTEGFKKSLGIHRLTGVLKGKRTEGGGYPAHSFAVSTRLHPYPGGNKAWVPVVIPNAKSTPAFAEFVNAIVNPAA